ncbi:MAG: nuclear transport factor 2 family protein [Reichenbachiella sp.]
MRTLIIFSLILGACGTAIKKENILIPSSSEIDEVLNQWHADAATGQLDSYFEAIHDDGHFLGTDKTEDWSKEEFYQFCIPHFEDGKAWDFKPTNRKVYFTPEGKTSWFSEILDTWMGPCRGSGVLISTNNGWKITQYNLTILVDNDDVDSYLEVVKKRENEEK